MLWKIVVVLTLAVCGGWTAAQSPQPATPETPTALVEQPPDGHLEIALSGSRGAALEEGALSRFLPQVRASGFLERMALSIADPLAPCALVSAFASADLMNSIFFGLARPGVVDLRPPAGTNILGLYDADLARGKGGIPRDDPAKAADMLARLVVYRSWALSSMLNTMMASMPQGQCLDLLMRPERLGQTLKRLKPSDIVLTHGAPVTAFIASVDHLQGRQWLEALPKPEMLAQPAMPAENPLAPCALLSAFRLAARLNDAWAHALPAGRFDSAGRSELAPYAEALKKPLVDEAATAEVAEFLAAVFAAEIARANWLSAQLTVQATQGECLDEMFQPGRLRQKLQQSGVNLPMR